MDDDTVKAVVHEDQQTAKQFGEEFHHSLQVALPAVNRSETWVRSQEDTNR